jgi:hypothetical protein
MLPDADWITKVVTVGPPVLLVVGLLIILQAAARNVIDLRKTALLSGIVAVFFGLWIVALPELRTRRIAIMTTMAPGEFLKSYSLRPIQYRIETADAKDADLDNGDVLFPNSSDTLTMRFNLEGLIQSYEDNLDTVISIAQNDPECFRRATQGVSYSRVAARIKEKCPASLLLATTTETAHP